MKDKIWMFIVWRLPKTLIKWAVIRATAYATTGSYGTTDVPSLPVMEVVKRWDNYA